MLGHPVAVTRWRAQGREGVEPPSRGQAKMTAQAKTSGIQCK